MPSESMSKGMDFAKKQLEKMGWKEGSGLGKKEAGISEALRPKLKFDSSGLGHSRSEEFTYHWWDHAFNKAASALEIKTTEEGPKVVKKDVQSKPGVSRKKVNVDGKDLTYGVFQKSGILSNGEMDETEAKVEITTEEKDYSIKLSDEELFKICGGRTAHKGARHGHRCTGKLARVAQQEALLLAQMQSLGQKSGETEKTAEPETTVDGSPEKRKKSKKKKKDKSAAREEDGETEQDSTRPKRRISCHDDDQGEQENPPVDRPEKKRKKKKRTDSDS